MSLSQPKSPDPMATAGIQSAFNTQAANQMMDFNAINQNTPFGSLTYTGNPATGMTATQQLTPQLQELLKQFQGTQGGLGSLASKLLGNMGSYADTPDFTSASAPLVQSQMKAFHDYMAPTYKQQESNLDAKLQDQGLPQGGAAWTNAQRGQMTSEDQAAQSELMNFEPQAFQQAYQTWQAPEQMLAALFGLSAPSTGLGLTNTPTVNLQPANYQGAAQQDFTNRQNQFQNTMSGMGGIGSSIAGMFGLGNGGLAGLFGLGGQGAGGGGIAGA